MITAKKESNTLSANRFNREIIDSLISQLEKDVLLCGGSLNLSPHCSTDLEILKAELQQYVSIISVANPALLFNLLYRVDVPQKLLESEDIATLLLKRVLAKVLIRLSYK
jgi:hypothetical protein